MYRLALAALAIAFQASLFAPLPAQAADAETIDMPEHIRAKMARYKSKRFDQGSGGGSSFMDRRSGVVGGCGGVNVGNVTSGRGVGSMPREVTVIVTGDVINANNKCN